MLCYMFCKCVSGGVACLLGLGATLAHLVVYEVICVCEIKAIICTVDTHVLTVQEPVAPAVCTFKRSIVVTQVFVFCFKWRFTHH